MSPTLVIIVLGVKKLKPNVFKGYLSVISALGRLAFLLVPHATSLHSKEASEVGQNCQLESFDLLDAKALALGNQYRALGIIIGLLGIVIVFCAIAPVGLQVGEHAEHAFGAIKVTLMLVMLLVVVSGRYSKLRLRWVSARRDAERIRYQQLADAIDALAVQKDGSGQRVRVELSRILDGESGQIAYNRGKAKTYQDVEHFGEVLLWTSFAMVLIGATGHLLNPIPEWILLTAFFPAAVGALHGINGFLGISSLAEEHEVMAEHLSQASASLQQVSLSNDDEQLYELAKGTLDILNTRDARWASTIRKVEGLKVHA